MSSYKCIFLVAPTPVVVNIMSVSQLCQALQVFPWHHLLFNNVFVHSFILFHVLPLGKFPGNNVLGCTDTFFQKKDFKILKIVLGRQGCTINVQECACF